MSEFLNKIVIVTGGFRGNGLSIEEWLSYGTEESLTLYMYQNPKRAKRLYFDTIPRNVDEYSRFLSSSKNQDIDPMRYPDFSKKPSIINFNELCFKYFVYLEVKDESGVLALISKIFAEHKISFDKVIQKDQLDNGNVPMVIFTDPVIESEMQIALKDLKSNSVIHNAKIIRIEDL